MLHQLIDQLDDARAETMLVLLSPPNDAENGQSAEFTFDRHFAQFGVDVLSASEA